MIGIRHGNISKWRGMLCKALILIPPLRSLAQTTVKASNYFTLDTNGLKQPWYGRVWLNPPYSMPGIRRFVDKLIDEYHADRIEQAIILVNNATDTGWFHDLLTTPTRSVSPKGGFNFVPRSAGESRAKAKPFSTLVRVQRFSASGFG